jgi:hypothetical protein
MRCPKCGSENVNVQVVNEVKHRGCLMLLVHIFLIIITFGLWWIVPILRGGARSKTKSYAVCQSCGNRWKV